MSALFGPRPAIHVVDLEQLPPRPGGYDECRWRVTLEESDTGHDNAGDVEMYVAESAFHIGEHADVPTWMEWSVTVTHGYDRERGGSWIEQLQQEPQPIKLERGLNRG